MERARSLANEAMFTVALQRRRIRSNEPEDNVFVMRWWADLQFFIVALRRLRRAAELTIRVSSARPGLTGALSEFDRALPSLTVMRNVGEHIEDYAIGKGHDGRVDRHQIQMGTFDGVTYQWLGKFDPVNGEWVGESLNIDVAHDAASELCAAIFAAALSHDG